jgi:hypothetical protein
VLGVSSFSTGVGHERGDDRIARQASDGTGSAPHRHRIAESKTDWRSVVGIFEGDSEGIVEIIEEGRRIREADRSLAAAMNGEDPGASDAWSAWLQFGGMFAGDPIFAEVVEIMEANRRREDEQGT